MKHIRMLALIIMLVVVPLTPLVIKTASAAITEGSFGGHTYQVVNNPMTWPEAADYCAQQGGYLVTINSAEENQFVYDLLPFVTDQWWLGGSDAGGEGTWEWVTGEPFDYTNWGPGEPNDAYPGPDPDPTLGEDYLTFHGYDAYTPALPGVWNDWQYEIDGSESTLPFVCEILSIQIEVKPGSLSPTPVNPNSEGKIPVAIISSSSFDATTVDPATVRFGAIGDEAAPVHIAVEDVNKDGLMDMITHFDTQSCGIVPGTTMVSLTGQTLSGLPFTGTDVISTVGM